MIFDGSGEVRDPLENWHIMNKPNTQYHLMSTTLKIGDIILITIHGFVSLGILDKINTISLEISMLAYNPWHNKTSLVKKTLYDLKQVELNTASNAKEQFAEGLC